MGATDVAARISRKNLENRSAELCVGSGRRTIGRVHVGVSFAPVRLSCCDRRDAETILARPHRREAHRGTPIGALTGYRI